ncbi:MAG: cupin domain-containing protein [Acidimicrobiales bacterium]
MSGYSDPSALIEGRALDRTVDHVVNGIGPRLRDLRLQHGLSLQQLAERAGVSAAAIHKIERNGMVPTITTLLKLADAFERPVAYFVDEESDAGGPVAFTPSGERPVVFSSRPGVEVQAISGSYAQFFLAASIVTVAPAAGGGPSRRAQGQHEELVMVLEGSLRFEVDGHEYLLGTGDSLHLRTDRPHRWENTGPQAAQLIWLTLRPLQSCAVGV